MKKFFRVTDWPLRLKIGALLVLTSLLPLVVSGFLDVRENRRHLLKSTENLLAARGDQLVRELDTFHRGFQRSANRSALLPVVVRVAQVAPLNWDRLMPEVLATLETHPASDARIRGAAILDLSGRVIAATESKLLGRDLSNHRFVRDALHGRAVISDVYLETFEDSMPTIAYLAPIRGADGRNLTALFAVWVRATALWDVMKTSNALAGPGSFAVLFDEVGIRIAHTYSDDIVFHPGGALDPAIVNEWVAESRLGPRTRALLEAVQPFPEQFERSRSPSPDTRVFRGYAPANKTWCYGVARRFETVPWTVFYMLPEESVIAEIHRRTEARVLLVAAITLIALAAGAGLAALILRSIRALSLATQGIAAGNLGARVSAGPEDELGRLGSSFNAMAERIEAQARDLERARDGLERRVQERTAELVQTARNLEIEVVERKRVQSKLGAQLQRLHLLHQITRAISERLDLKSIFQVAVRSVEGDLPVDFCCLCLYDAPDRALIVSAVAVRSEQLAESLALPEQSRVAIDANGLARCLAGELVYEPDLGKVPFQFPQRLSGSGLRSMVVAPLAAESQVFGVVVAARTAGHAFESGECEFLKQLSEHVALATHQAQLYGALEGAYEDLRKSQQAVLQQERLRALGQMASGIAHDINNAIMPVAVYTELLLEHEPNLSARAREFLQTIKYSVADVSHTLGRMREFYRQRDEPELEQAPLDLGPLVRQVMDLSRARWSDMPQQRGVVVKLVPELAPDLPNVMGAASEIREALINLVFNAVDAMPAGGILSLRTGREENRVFVEVADTGVGMSEETRRRCMEPFFTTKGERGTGLGLAMVYGVAKRHDADVGIESAVGVGTKVRLTFTVAAASSQSAETAAPKPAVAPSRLRILIVDDDPVLLKSLLDFLEADGHVVVAANQGQAAIDEFKAAQKRGKPFAVVITDLGMPYVDGRQVANAIKVASPTTPVILLTGWGQRMAAEGDVPEHVDFVLSKPPHLRELRDALVKCCRADAS